VERSLQSEDKFVEHEAADLVISLLCSHPDKCNQFLTDISLQAIFESVEDQERNESFCFNCLEMVKNVLEKAKEPADLAEKMDRAGFVDILERLLCHTNHEVADFASEVAAKYFGDDTASKDSDPTQFVI
jgi:hypothetical protein